MTAIVISTFIKWIGISLYILVMSYFVAFMATRGYVVASQTKNKTNKSSQN